MTPRIQVLNQENPSLWKALIPEKWDTSPYLLTAIGGGGKTSLLTTLADESRCQGIPTLLTTTTHMRVTPEADLSENISTIVRKIAENSLCFCGAPCENGKLTGLGAEKFAQILPHCTLALVEGDGSRGLPLKWPGKQEPVIPSQTNRIVLVCGMSAIGGQLKSVCHRWTRSNLPGDTAVTPQVASKILKQGYLAKLQGDPIMIVFNQCDTPFLRAAAMEIAERLELKHYLLTRREDYDLP